ncbi:MAG: leucine-rich repeat protein [Clostridia bacterium]|nr:leucine-rich repeat protein [Clostridia bacterium]
MKKFLVTTLVVLTLIAALTVMISAENLIDQSFHTTTGDIKWAFFESAGKLAYNNTEYAAGTLVIYGDGTAYGYSQTPTSDGSGYPWKAVMSKIKTVVFDTPNLTTIQTFRYMRNYSELYIPAGVTTFASSLFAGSWSLNTIKVAEVDYSEYGDTYIYDLRNIKSFSNYSFDGVANNVEENITILLGKDTSASFTSTSGKFAENSKSTFTFVVYKDSKGETFAKSLVDIASSANIADNIKIEYYPEPATGAMSFVGYQVRTTGYNGLRGVFSFDKTVINEGRECVEYGTILTTKANKEAVGTELTENNGEFETANKKIVKLPVVKNGELVGKCWSDDENKLDFAATVVNFKDNYKTPIYMCGYEIWKDSKGNTEIVYTEYCVVENEVYTPSIYEVVLEFFANGLLNASDEDDKKVLWGVLDNCRNEITSTSDTYAVENNIIKHTSADVNIHTFTRSDDSVVAIITGSGTLKDVSKILYNAGVAPEVVVIDHGFTVIGYNCFTRPVWEYKPFKTIIYPDGITSLGTTNFQGLSNLETVFKVHTSAEAGTVDISYINEVELSYLFNGASKIKYIHLPTNLTKKNNVVLTVEAFQNCTSLSAIWCGDNKKPTDGTADFTGTTITESGSKTFNGANRITNFIWGEAVSQ